MLVKRKKVGVFIGGTLGFSLLEVLINSKEVELRLVALSDSSLLELATSRKDLKEVEVIIIPSSILDKDTEQIFIKSKLDVLFLLYWPFMVSNESIRALSAPIFNCHLSLLPFNRGKNPNVWPIIDGTPAGVTIHQIDEGIDSGLIVCQQEIMVDILDTGESLYRRLCQAMLELFKSKCDEILRGDFTFKENNLSLGNLNFSQRFQKEKEISLSESISPIILINKLRAYTFTPYESAYFYLGERKISIRIQLSEEN